MTEQTPLASAPLEKSLPSRCYLDEAFFAAEKDRLFAPSWVCAGREEDVADPGSTLLVDLLGESVIVARLADGSLRAHYNVCRHRGAKLCGGNDAKWGVALNGGVDRQFIRCPYHQWTYGLDGALLNAPHLGRAEGFDRADFALHPVGIGSWGGFFFLKLSPDPAEPRHVQLTEADIGPAPRRLANYPLAALRTARTISYEVDANWKVIAENYNECYHCGGVHPELCEVVPLFRKGGGFDLDWENGIPHKDGAWTYTFTGTTDRAPFAGLDEHELTRHKGELVYPNLLLSVSADHAAAFLLWPIAAGRTRVEVRFLFAGEEIARPGFDGSDAIDFWDITNRQDWAVCERVQAGMATRVHAHGYYAPMEDDSLDIRRYVTRHLGGQAVAE